MAEAHPELGTGGEPVKDSTMAALSRADLIPALRGARYCRVPSSWYLDSRAGLTARLGCIH